jgi:3-phenylpropionate/trans-cinnamate dioxygenase ferredoxin reductase subunit
MTSYDYLIVGAGVAAASAVKGIRDADSDATIAVFGDEKDAPVYRPDLSKSLWLDADKSLQDSALLPEAAGLELHTETEVTAIRPDDHEVELADGSSVTYGKLLLATGAQPRTLGVEPGERVIFFRSAADYRRLRSLTEGEAHVAVVGGGYIGSEIAAALSQNDVKVTMVLPEDLVQEAMFPRGLAERVTTALADHGVEIVHGKLDEITATDDGVRVVLEGGDEVTADAAVVGVGVEPRTKLAEDAGLEVENGIVVDESLRTSAKDVRLGRRRVEHVDNAEKMGAAAGRSMGGEKTAYDTTPMFFSDLYDDGYEAIGELSSKLEMVEDFEGDDYGKGVVYYVEEGRVRGVLLWNVWDSVDKARELIEQTAEEPLSDSSSLEGRIPLD